MKNSLVQNTQMYNLHQGSQADMGVYMAVLEPGDKILGMNLSDGGHNMVAQLTFRENFITSCL